MRGPQVILRAPAKLTRSLRIVGRRADGYHLLEAEMVSLEWGDDLLVQEGGDGLAVLDRMARGGAASPAAGLVPEGPDNLVARALALTGRRAAVRLTKRVPPGAGLGGGSSDAAAILRWAGVRGDRAGLQMAAGLGADVPFCLVGGRARVSGVGERVEALEPVDMGVTLLLVPFACSTPAVYAQWDRDRSRGGFAEGGADHDAGQGDRAINDLAVNDLAVNDLEEAAVAVEPRLRAWRDAFGAATGRPPALAGSGSTWFVEEPRPDLAGPFPDPEGPGPPGYVVVTRTDRP